ncbi:MAG: type 4a pilus biogenesis protein PilO [Candidatus Shapirobacteria bacterium]
MNDSNRRYQRYFQEIGQLYQQKKVRFYTQIIATLGAIIFFLAFAIKPTVVTITQLLKEIADKKEVEIKLDQKIQALMAAQKTYTGLEAYLPLLDQALPAEARLSPYLNQLESLARQNNVQLTALQTGQLVLKDTPQPRQDHFVLTFTLNSPYANLKTFLNDFSRLRRLAEITGFSVKTDSKTPDNLNLTLTAKIYIFDQANVSQ